MTPDVAESMQTIDNLLHETICKINASLTIFVETNSDDQIVSIDIANIRVMLANENEIWIYLFNGNKNDFHLNAVYKHHQHARIIHCVMSELLYAEVKKILDSKGIQMDEV